MKGTTRLSEISSQLISLLNQLDDQSYGQALAILSNASIGQHFRHILDFYNCLIVGAEKGRIDYAQRERNSRIESDVAYAIHAFENTWKNLAHLEESKRVEICISGEESDKTTVVNSSIGRELMYAFDHAIHHLAIIKIGLQTHFPQIEITQKLGVAPSTLKYRAKQQAMQVSSS